MKDQADILAELEKLKTEATSKDAELSQARADLDAAKASLKSTADELATVKDENEKLNASQTDFDKKVAAEVAKKGIRADALPAAATSKPSNKPQPTGLARAIAAEKSLNQKA